MGGRSNNFDVIPGREEKLTYGKRFAQTEERYEAHRMEKELEELAERPVEARRESKRGTPIGALPMATEPPPRDRFSALTDDAERHARLIRDSVRDIGRASYRLARLPFEAMLLAARRFRPARG
jgi:hypothetical protein